MKIKAGMGAALLAVAVAGCSGPDALQAQYGNSVRELVAAQTADPGASARNGEKAREGTDPVRAVSAIEATRGGVTKPTETWNSNIEIGSSSTVTDNK